MDTTTLGLVVFGVVIVAIIAAWMYTQRQRRVALRERFGPEYDRTVETVGAPAKADDILEERTKRVEQFEIVPLAPADRERFSESWRRVQALFVDNPGRAVTEADGLIGEVMRTRGYPVEADFDRRVDDLSVHHAPVVEHYRAGRELAFRQERGTATTEDMRQAMVHFRELFSDLVTSTTESAPARARRAS